MSAVRGQSRPFGALERTLAWRYLRAQREHGGASLISVISFLGIMLAVTALIVTMSLMNGFRSTLTNALIGGQGHVFALLNDMPEDEALGLAARITDLKGIDTVVPTLEGQVLVDSGFSQSGAIVRGVRAEDLPIYEGLLSTDIAGFGEGRNGGNVILIGSQLARRMGVIQGGTVTLLGAKGPTTAFGAKPTAKEYIIGGLIQTGSFELDNAYIFMPFDQAQIFFQQKGVVRLLDIRLDDYLATMPARERIAAEIGTGFRLEDWKDRNGAYLGALKTESGVMRLIMLVLITITSLNIITGVVMLVKNKSSDIAILRTIGATRSAMMRVFIMIGGVLGLSGALIGLVLGVLLVVNIDSVEWALNSLSGGSIFPAEVYGLSGGLPAKLNLWEAVGTTAWAMAMSMIVTIWPAWLAAKTDPVDALRFE